MVNNSVVVSSHDFVEVLEGAQSGDFCYLDPPYLNTDGDFNSMWGELQETILKDTLAKAEYRWALSNDLTPNPDLEKWALDHGFNIYFLDHSYKFSNYQRKDTGKTQEVLITNYPREE